MIRRLLRNRSLVVAYLVMGLGFTASLYIYSYDQTWDDYRRCTDAVSGRTAVREVIVEAYAPGEPLTLTALPSFAALDLETQQYLRDLEVASQEAGSSTLRRDRLLSLVPLPECTEPALL